MAASIRPTYLLFFLLSTCFYKALVKGYNVTVSNTTVSFLPGQPRMPANSDFVQWRGPGSVTFDFEGSYLNIKGGFGAPAICTNIDMLYEVYLDDDRQEIQNKTLQVGSSSCDRRFFSRTGLDARTNHQFKLVSYSPAPFWLGDIEYNHDPATIPANAPTNITPSDSPAGSPLPASLSTGSSSGQPTTTLDASSNDLGPSEDPTESDTPTPPTSSGIRPDSTTSVPPPTFNSSEPLSNPATSPIPSSAGSSASASGPTIYLSSSRSTPLATTPSASSQSLGPEATEVTDATESSVPLGTSSLQHVSMLTDTPSTYKTPTYLATTKNDGGAPTSQDLPLSTPHPANSTPPESNPVPLPSIGITYIANSVTPESNPIPPSSGLTHVANSATPESESATTPPSDITSTGLSPSDVTLDPSDSASKLDGVVLTPGPTMTTTASLALGSMISRSGDITSRPPLPSALSPSPSSSILNSASSSVVSSKTSDAAPIGGTNTSKDSAHNEGHHRTATIIGGTVGAVVGSILLAGAAYAASRREWLKYIWSSVGLVLGFGFAYSAHRFIFVGDPELPETRIALFIAPLQAGDEKEKDLLVWNAFTVGPGQNDLILNVPCTTTGQPRFYFGQYQTRNNHVSCLVHAESPVVVESSEGSEECRIIRDAESMGAYPGRKGKQPIRATNNTNMAIPLVLGTGREISLDQDSFGLSPFMEVSTSQFGPSATYQLEEELYLHAFTVKNECQSGQFCKQINEPDGMLQDRITKPGGIRLDELKGLTTLVVKRGKGGKLELKIVRNKKEDVKKYQHECKIDPSALRQDAEPREHENHGGIGSDSRELV